MNVVVVVCVSDDPERIMGDGKTSIKSRMGQACEAEACVCICESTHAKGKIPLPIAQILLYIYCVD